MTEPTLFECFGPNITNEIKRKNQIAADKSMEDMMVKYLRIAFTEADSGDCEYGCWTTGYGVQVYLQSTPEYDVEGTVIYEYGVEGTVIYEQEAWASCLDSSSVDYDALLKFIKEYTENDSSYILDLGDTSDYPESFLDEVM